jgi:preprotein translocase subunit YajC
MLLDLPLHPVLAQSGQDAAAANPIASLLPFLLIGLVFYFLIIRPQKRRQQQQQALIRSLGVGDRVVTIGGFHAEIVELAEDTARLELAPGVVVTIARTAIARPVGDPLVLDDDPLDDDPLDRDVDDDLDGDAVRDQDPLQGDPRDGR